VAVTPRADSPPSATFECRGATYRLARLRGPEMGPLVPLFRKVYKRRDFSRQWLEQKYACEYRGISGSTYAAFTEAGQAVAAVGVLPWPIRFGTRTEIGGQLVDAATDVDHRGRGLFTRVTDMAREHSAADGISLIFGFARHQGDSYPRLIRHLGYEHLDDLIESRMSIRTVFAERIARRVGALRPLYERYLQRTLSAHASKDTVLQNSLLADGFAATDRTAAFHAYKSFAGNRVIAVDGGRVWLNVKRGLLVGDLEAVSEADMRKTACSLERLAARLGVHQIAFQASTDTRFSRGIFELRSPATPMLAVVYRNLGSEIPHEKLRFTFGDLDNF
jgi:hypothetical protein